MIPAGFFPEGIAVSCAEAGMWEQPAYPEEEKLLSATAADKRKREFRAGRHCAHAVLEQLGYKHFSVLRGERGEPLWPENICGSISHGGERCMAIAARKTDYLSIGVDIEKDRDIKDDTLERISHASERQQIERAPASLREVNLRAVLFSAKECVHKVYYPLNHHTLDFHDVEVTFDWDKHSFDVRILKPVSQAEARIDRLSGKFAWEEGYVYSQICLQNGLAQTK